jgi:hypothetical protein
VVGELRRILVIDRRIRVRESVGEPPMETGPFARQEFAVDSLLEQRVAEDECLPGTGIERNEDVAFDRLPKVPDEIRFITFRDAREETRRHPRPGRGGLSKELLGRLTKSGQANEQNVAQHRRKRASRRLDGKQLLDEERVPARTTVDSLE